jgi:uncharacterized lipoprotein YehR (DUF1307 family)
LYRYKKGILAFISIIVLIGMLVGCASSNMDSSSSKSSELAQTQSSAAGNFDSETSYVVNETAAMADGGPAEGNGESKESGGGIDSQLAIGTDEFNQKIIYTATLSMQVDELASAATSLRNAIHQSGGYLLQFQDTKHEGEIGSSYTIKVPAAGFMSFIDRIEQIKHNEFERNIGGKDVSEEYVDLESRLKAKQLVEARLLTMMDKATKADDLLKFSQQLSGVQEEIERIKGRVRYLDNNVAFSTVELRMYQTNQTLKNKSLEQPHLGGRMSDALVNSTKVVWDAINLLLVVLAGALPVLAILAVILIPSIWLYRRRKEKAPKQTVPDDEQPPVL